MFLPLLAVLASIVSLCVGSSFAKHLFAAIGPEGATALRVGFSALMLILVWRPWRFTLSMSDAKAIASYGVILGVMNLMFYMAIGRIPIGIAIAIEFLGPLALAVWLSRRPMDFLWTGFAVAGLVLLLPLKLDQQTNHLDPVGIWFAVASAVCWALYIVFGKRAGKAHAGQVTSIGLAIAAMVVLPFGIIRAGTALLTPSHVLFGLAVALMSSAIPYSLEMYALKRLPKQTFGILLSMEPAVGALSGWLILHELLTPLQWLAILLVMIASIGSTVAVRVPDNTPARETEVLPN